MSFLNRVPREEHRPLVPLSGELNTRVIALAGNPNVGKSTVFNALTGMKQHTGNWPGKTVASARGQYRWGGRAYTLVDIPGTYSLMANSPEEEVARDFICFGRPDTVVVVADATCLERNLNLVLQVMEVTPNVVLCVNLMDEAEKKGIRLSLSALSEALGIPVVGASARSGRGLTELKEAVAKCSDAGGRGIRCVTYAQELEAAIAAVIPRLAPFCGVDVNPRWAALRLLEGEKTTLARMREHLSIPWERWAEIIAAAEEQTEALARKGMAREVLQDHVASRVMSHGAHIAAACVVGTEEGGYSRRDRRVDRLLTSRLTGIPVMIALLALIFYLTITGANYLSDPLLSAFSALEGWLGGIVSALGAPPWLHGLLITGMLRTLCWVVAVMLPPMAIFFPLFTLLEDLGYLPRIAFNLDRVFKKAGAHGKQALTMAMGFGCNACAVMGCRIIDSPRERLIAILTNNFVPCNGRFPTLIAIITMFFVGVDAGAEGSVLSALLLTGVILFGVMLTLLASGFLSRTLLRGMPSAFVLELPPYRRPQVGKVIVRSVFDRTLFVLGRAMAVAAPAGMLIWTLSNTMVGGSSILWHCIRFLDPVGRLMGMDGVILMGFLLGFPANEIVVPVILMGYLSTGGLVEAAGLGEMYALLTAHGWTWLTALCTMLFSLCHFPCGTTCWTIKKETGSWRWTALGALLPTGAGAVLCILIAAAVRLTGLV